MQDQENNKRSKVDPIAADPHAEREAEKYENPVPSREFILKFLEEEGKPLPFKVIAARLGIEDEERLEGLSRRLKAMVRDGQLLRNRRGAYGIVKRMHLVKGRIIGHPDGFGFLVPEDPEVSAEDIYIPAHEMHKVLHGDEVLVSVVGEDKRGRKEGVIVEVIRRHTQKILGRLHLDEYGLAWVQPSNPRITQDLFIPGDGLGGAKEGQVVLAEIIRQPTRRSGPVGRVIKVLGDYLDPGLEIESAIYAYDIPNEWSAEALAELDEIPDTVLEEEKKGRKDLRHLPLVTIDGVDSKDFDDAVFAKRRKNGWRLVVAIADVSHYVQPGSALDEDAYRRGNSVYFPQLTVPMLPEKLSNGLCSLNPHVDRLCMVADMEISEEGKLRRSQFYPAVMHSHARLTYDEVYQALTNENYACSEDLKAVLPHVKELYELYQVLRKQREQRGVLDFDTVETRIEFDENRKIKEIVPVIRNDAHKLIEECMLMANVAAAKHLAKFDFPILYRVHEPPKPERLQELRTFLADFGLTLRGGDAPTAADFAAVLKQVEGKPYANLVQTVMLRSMNQAVYQPENKGHFGLNFDCYTHFTSPIRRYPDLIIHRALRHVLEKELYPYDLPRMEEIGGHCSETERRADEATRDAVNFLKCEYLSHHLGNEYDGIISAVTNFGIFVELQPLYVEGLVHVTELGDDYFVYDRARHCLVGERTRRRFRIGDPVRVQVAQVNLDERKVELRLLKAPDELGVDNEAGDVTEAQAEAGRDEEAKKRKPRRRGGRGRGSKKAAAQVGGADADKKATDAPKRKPRRKRTRKPRAQA
ncbi:RNAse R [Sulfurivirga caldicuralii]|uniref:Ribonuclease R n=1 Tax=Sulfurivirga caldicuralii TaxID=364032 RepID=A0A1N6FIK7_9GAMM|nr:ribonuclease R [Sulfurivirga caldicuralii]SIN95109.1 RNAse R [Sulfurivirga caldicuralii]